MKKIIFFGFTLITLTSCLFELSEDAMIKANLFALDSASKVSQEIENKGRCPSKLEGWEVALMSVDVKYVSRAGSEDVKYSLRMTCSKNLTFEIILKYGFDSGTWLSGGKGKDSEITYGHFTNLKHITFNDSSNLNEIAEKVVNER